VAADKCTSNTQTKQPEPEVPFCPGKAMISEAVIQHQGLAGQEEMLNGNKELKSRFGVVNFEKRKHPRFMLNLPIEYRRVPMESHGATGCTANATQGEVMA
jgi:hypothetical protein